MIPEQRPDPSASLEILNVGQGDSVVLQLSTGEIIVVDCHVASDSQDGIPPLLPRLEEMMKKSGRSDIDVLCITHPDRDHYKGLTDVLAWLKSRHGRVRNLVTFGGPTFREYQFRVGIEHDRLRTEYAVNPEALRRIGKLTLRNEELVELFRELAVIRRGITPESGEYKRATNGCSHVVTFGEARIYLLGPISETVHQHTDRFWSEMITSWYTDTEPDNISCNELSCVLLVILGEAKVLLGGDSTCAALSAVIQTYETTHKTEVGVNLECHVVLAPHHGSRTSSKPDIWDKVLVKQQPCVAISAGRHHGYNHPHVATLTDIRTVRPDVRVFCTNGCPLYVGITKQASFSTVELPFWENESGPSERAASVNTVYNGDCRFDISYKGNVIPRPRFTPDRSCRLHTDEVTGLA